MCCAMLADPSADYLRWVGFRFVKLVRTVQCFYVTGYCTQLECRVIFVVVGYWYSVADCLLAKPDLFNLLLVLKRF